VKNRRIGYASKLQATVNVFFGSIAPQSPKAVRPSTSAMPRNRTQGQGIAPGAKGPKPTDSCTAASSAFFFDHLVGERKPLGRHVEADITSHPDSHDEQPHFDVSRSEDIDLK
jgi:hypothetical protein